MEVMKIEPYLEQRRTHGGSGPIPCPQCGKMFAKEFDIKRHMFTHTGEKPFKCEICNRGFSQKSTLKVHLNIHTGDMPYECSMCNKKFRQKQGLNAHVKANRCKVGPLRGITNSPGSNSSSSTHSERSNSPRTVPYPTANQNRAPGLNPNIKPKENVLSPAALLKLLSQPITVSNSVHGYGTPTLSPTNQISLTGLQNLSNLIQTMRENNLRLPQSTATIPPRPTAVKTSTSFQPRFPFTESTRSPIGHPLANPIGHLADQSEGSNEEAEIEEVEIVELDESSEDLMKIPSREDSRISSSSPTSDDSSSSTTVGNNNRKGRRKQANPSKLVDTL